MVIVSFGVVLCPAYLRRLLDGLVWGAYRQAMTIDFQANCPHCGKPSIWTASQFGTYPDVISRITHIEHGETFNA